MATKTNEKTAKTKSLNETLVSATTATINATVENGEKWQKLTKKLIKKSEPLRRKQMDMVFDTAAAVKNQFNSGKERAMDLVGYEEVIAFAKNNPVSQKVTEVSDTIKTRVNENPVVQQVGKTSESLKTKGTAKFNDIKGDVLEQAQKILNKGEKMVEGALSTKKAEKPVAKAKAPAKSKAKAPATKNEAKSTAAKATKAEASAAKTTESK